MNRDAGRSVGRERATAVALVLASVISPQVGAAFAVTLFGQLGPAGTAFLRLAIAAVVLCVIWRPRLAGDLRPVAAFGIALGLMNWSFYEAIDRIPLGVAVTIEFAGPLLLAVIGSRRLLDVLWIVLAAAGILLLVGPGGGAMDPVGIAFALVAALCWMAEISLSKRVGAAYPGGSGLAIAMVVGALLLLPFGSTDAEPAFTDPRLLGAVFVVAMASSVVPYSLELEALRRLPAGIYGVLLSLDPAVAALAGLVVLHQALGAREVAGIAMVVVASAGAALLGQRGPKSEGGALALDPK
jgi:inner membrane transporter RhtA